MEMPTDDCFETIGELRAEIENLKEWKRDHDKKEAARILAQSAAEAARLKSEAFKDGAVWALAKVGAVVVAALSAVGYVTIHGFPGWLRDLLR
jgi:FtsZ-binding cell division protein ZapB